MPSAINFPRSFCHFDLSILLNCLWSVGRLHLSWSFLPSSTALSLGLYFGGPKISAGNSSAHWKYWHFSFCLHMQYGLKGFFSDLDHVFATELFSTFAYFICRYHMANDTLLIVIDIVFTTEEGALSPIQTAKIRYSRSGFDYFKVLLTEFSRYINFFLLHWTKFAWEINTSVKNKAAMLRQQSHTFNVNGKTHQSYIKSLCQQKRFLFTTIQIHAQHSQMIRKSNL